MYLASNLPSINIDVMVIAVRVIIRIRKLTEPVLIVKHAVEVMLLN